jgi:hypothetical protein
MRLGQGRENAKEFLKQNVSVAQEIEQQIRDMTVKRDPDELVPVSVNGQLDDDDSDDLL